MLGGVEFQEVVCYSVAGKGQVLCMHETVHVSMSAGSLQLGQMEKRRVIERR